MASYVLDTHALVFALTAPAKLGRRARAALKRVESNRDEAWVPAAVVAELILLRELGRIDVGLAELRSVLEERANVRFLALELAQLDLFRELSGIRDPFDRLIVSAAKSTGAKLLSKDEHLGESHLVEVVWA